MPEKRPSQADHHDIAIPACRVTDEAFISLRATRGGGEPPDKTNRTDNRQPVAGNAVQDGNGHVRAPSPYGKLRRQWPMMWPFQIGHASRREEVGREV